MAERFPLTWPSGWPRSPRTRRSPFDRDRDRSLENARTRLETELLMAGARVVVLSTNVQLRLDGKPYSNQAQPADRGVAVYFVLEGKPVALACDRWDRVEDNVYAIAKHVEALRGQERWGVGTVAQAFAGYAQLPPPSGAPTTPSTTTGPRPWREVLRFEFPPADAEAVERRFKSLARERHPDAGGSDAAMAELNVARAAALAEIGGGRG
jgi:hypothetical protein